MINLDDKFCILQMLQEIARKADETKTALKKSIVDVEQVIKGLINA